MTNNEAQNRINNFISTNYNSIRLYIIGTGILKKNNEEFYSQLLSEITIYLLEPFSSTTNRSILKRKGVILHMIRTPNDEELLKYSFRWLKNQLVWLNDTRRKKISLISRDIQEYCIIDNENDFNDVLMSYNNLDIHNYKEEDIIDITKENILKLRDLIETIEPWNTNLYKLRYIEGRTIREICEETKLSAPTIYTQLKKLNNKIEEEIKKC